MVLNEVTYSLTMHCPLVLEPLLINFTRYPQLKSIREIHVKKYTLLCYIFIQNLREPETFCVQNPQS
jgi:hypothetical protein